jgi:hypothetical protein
MLKRAVEVLQHAPGVTAAYVVAVYRCCSRSYRVAPSAVECHTPTQRLYSAGARRSCAAYNFDSVL